MVTLKRFEDMQVWQDARHLTAELYRLTASEVFARDYGLINQMRRASVSIMSNIAEGFERDGTREFRQFLSQAKASAGEVRAQVYAALDAGYLTPDAARGLLTRCESITRQLSGFMRYLEKSPYPGRKYVAT